MFARQPLRTDVAAEIQVRIIDGRLAAGTRINETTLATELGISRTPLREAMLCLLTEGALEADMGRGFRVPLLQRAELDDVLAVLALTASAAVQRGTGDEIQVAMAMRNQLGRAHAHQGEPAALCEHLYLYFRTLLEDCPNGVLRQESLRLLRRALRYLNHALQAGYQPLALLTELDAASSELTRRDRPAAGRHLTRACEGLAGDLSTRIDAARAEEA